jgi:hypothetical protein
MKSLSARDLIVPRLYKANPLRQIEQQRRAFDDSHVPFEVEAISQVSAEVGILPSAGGILLDEYDITVPRANLDITDINQAYDELRLALTLRPVDDDVIAKMTINGVTDFVYRWSISGMASGAAWADGSNNADTEIELNIVGLGNDATNVSSWSLYFKDYSNNSDLKAVEIRGAVWVKTGRIASIIGAGQYVQALPITRITVALSSGNIDYAKARLYGMAI